MSSQVMLGVFSVCVSVVVLDAASLNANLPPGNQQLGPSADLTLQPTSNMFERYSSSSFGGFYPAPNWNNGGAFNSWPYRYNQGFQPNPNYNPLNPFEQYNSHYPYNYFSGGNYGGGYGASNPIGGGVIGAARPTSTSRA